jgi:hypothetical protein
MLPLAPRFYLINSLLILTPFRVEAVKHFCIVLSRVILLVLLWYIFVILCLRKETLLQIGVIEELWWVTWCHCNLRVDWPWEGEQPEVWIRIIISKRWAIWALTAASTALGTMATAFANLCILRALWFPSYGIVITHPFDYLIFAFFVLLARHLTQFLFKILLLTLPEPVGEVTPRGAKLGSTVLFHRSHLSCW